MQTFLPYPDFARSLAVLDTPRLGKQRVETLQILRALVLPEYGWQNHPAVRMWEGRLPALVLYGLISADQWRQRGFGDSTAAHIAEFAPEAVGASQADLAAAGLLPAWLGDERLHRSHQSKLLGKNPDHYRQFFPDVPADLEYFWPDPDPAPTLSLPMGHELWVVQPGSAQVLGRFLQEGVISVGDDSGVQIDVTGMDLASIRQFLGPAARRNTRAIAALARWVDEIHVGDEVALMIDHGYSLVVGEIVGDYEYAARGADLGVHRRRVRWDRIVPRSAVQPVASMQDVRPLFRVVVAAQ